MWILKSYLKRVRLRVRVGVRVRVNTDPALCLTMWLYIINAKNIRITTNLGNKATSTGLMEERSG